MIKRYPKKTKKKKEDDGLWETFSKYIRLRDADENGICTCFTCGRKTVWNKNTDCGHGIPRQHKATKYNEQNNHAQCKPCNGFQGGMREVYKERMDERYGEGTWDKMLIASRQTVKLDYALMEEHYKNLVKQIREQYNL